MLIDSNTKKNASEYRRFYRQSVWVPVSLSVLFSACGSLGLQEGPQDGPPGTAINADAIKDIVPKAEPLSKHGNPTSYVAAGKRYYVMKSAAGYVKRGTASWYGTKFNGHRTANGEIYDMYAMTAAHKTLPIPSYVKVTNLQNHKSAIVRVNDRGPFYGNRLIDLSYAAAVKLGMTGHGTAPVEIRTITVNPALAAPPPNTVVSLSPPAQENDRQGIQTSSRRGLYIQVGAFAARQNAQRMQKKITLNTSYSVTISRGGAENTYFRVRVGPFSSNREVKAATTQLIDLGISDTVVLNNHF